MIRKLLFLLIFLSCSIETKSYKILIYNNLFGHSHLKSLGTVADALTDAGHNVTVLIPIIERHFLNKTCLNSTKNVIFVEQDDYLRNLMNKNNNRFESFWTSGGLNPVNMIKKAKSLSGLLTPHCRNVMSQSKLIEELKNENFDLAITEPFDTCAYAFFEAISIRAHVAVYSCSRLDHVSEVIGQPTPPSYVPGMQSEFGEKMNIWERFMNYFQFKGRSYIFSMVGDENFKVAREFYPHIRSWREVLPEASFIFTNQIPYLEFPAPKFDKMIPIGGFTVKTDAKSLKLEEKWDRILNERKTNVLISFGTNARSIEMPAEYKISLLKVFKSMSDTTFIWKYENPEDPFIKDVENVHLSSWLPQNELLADSRLTVFIAHGGLASVMELATMGKPAIMIPLAADQTRNVEMLKRHGGALALKKFDLANPVLVRDTIEKILNDSNYQRNADRLAEILHHQPTNPIETLVKHVEFAARFGKLPLLDNYGRHQSFIEYHFLDIISIVFIAFMDFLDFKMQLTRFLSSLIFIGCFIQTGSYKILVYTNLFGHSHLKVLGTVADALTDAGHNVTVLMPIIETQFLNKTCLKSTKNVIFVEQDDTLKQLMSQRSKRFETVWTSGGLNPFNMVKKAGMMSNLFSSHCRNMMSKRKLIEQLKNENFDLAITEPFDTCAYALFEAISIRAHVAVYSCSRLDHVSEVIGQPTPPSYVPGMQSEFGEKMNIWERFMNYFQFKGGSYIFSTIGDESYKAAQEFYPGIRSWREVLPEASFIFTNQIPYLDFPSPTLDKLIPIGGFTVKTDTKSLKLEEKWDRILNERKTNVLISFGTNARSIEMPAEYRKSLLQVFKSMPDTTFIWKYENPEDPFIKEVENVYLSSWLPQNELLADSRLTVFITHGGLASVMELAMMGKPAIMIPLASDQTRNAQMLKRHGGAVVLKKLDLVNPSLVQETLQNILKDSSYQENANRLAQLLHNQPTKPIETLVKYVEFAARFGKLPQMDNYGRHQSFIEYHFLDIISIVFIVFAVLFYFISKVLRVLLRRCFTQKVMKNKDE